MKKIRERSNNWLISNISRYQFDRVFRTWHMMIRRNTKFKIFTQISNTRTVWKIKFWNCKVNFTHRCWLEQIRFQKATSCRTNVLRGGHFFGPFSPTRKPCRLTVFEPCTVRPGTRWWSNRRAVDRKKKLFSRK